MREYERQRERGKEEEAAAVSDATLTLLFGIVSEERKKHEVTYCCSVVEGH